MQTAAHQTFEIFRLKKKKTVQQIQNYVEFVHQTYFTIAFKKFIIFLIGMTCRHVTPYSTLCYNK